MTRKATTILHILFLGEFEDMFENERIKNEFNETRTKKSTNERGTSKRAFGRFLFTEN